MMLRLSFLLLPMATTVAMGQQPWTFTHGHPDHDVLISDLVWTNDGVVLICTQDDLPSHQTHAASLIVLSNSGVLVNERVLAPEFNDVQASVVLAGPDQRLHVLGAYSQFPGDSVSGFFHFGCSQNGTVQDSSLIGIADARAHTLKTPPCYRMDPSWPAGPWEQQPMAPLPKPFC